MPALHQFLYRRRRDALFASRSGFAIFATRFVFRPLPIRLPARFKSAVVSAAGFTPAAMAARTAGALSGFCATSCVSGFTMIWRS
jgi:hypothetical protein